MKSLILSLSLFHLIFICFSQNTSSYYEPLVKEGCERVFAPHDGIVKSILIDPNFKELWVGTHNGQMKRWDCCYGTEYWSDKFIDSYKLPDTLGRVVRFDISNYNDDTILAQTFGNGSILLIGQGNFKDKFLDDNEGILAISFIDNNKYLLAGSDKKIISKWDVNTGKLVLTKTLYYKSGIKAIDFSPDGYYSICGGFDNNIRLDGISNPLYIPKFYEEHKSCITALRFHPDGKRFISASQDGIIKIWNVYSTNSVRTLLGHSDYITSIAISSDGRFILSVSYDKTLKLWDFNSGKCLKTFNTLFDGEEVVKFGLDDKYAFTGGDVSVKMWNIEPYTIGTSSSNIVVNKPVAPTSFPNLTVSGITLKDENNNNRIDGNEKCSINFTIENTGKGKASALKAKLIEANKSTGLSFQASTTIGELEPGAKKSISIPVNADINLIDGTANFSISFEEALGFPPDPVQLELATASFKKPIVKIADHNFYSESGTLKTGLPIQLKMLVQNTGQGEAQQVKVNCLLPSENVFVTGDKYFDIGTLKPGESKELQVDFIANKNYSQAEIPITISVREKYEQFSESLKTAAKLNSAVSQQKVKLEPQVVKESEVEIKAVSLLSDVDRNIPQNPTTNTSTYVLIIANENYREETTVNYALNDSRIFKEYCNKTLGIPAEQILYVEDAYKSYMEDKLDQLKELIKSEKGNAKVIFYYTGHGVPDEATKTPHLLPVEGKATRITSAISMETVYETLSEFPAKQVLVILDACFTGTDREEKMLAMAKGSAQNPRAMTLPENTIQLSASSGTQSAGYYHDNKHGMFTYYLLKKLQETKGAVRLGDLMDYLEKEVSKTSVLKNGKSQTPGIKTAPALADKWRSMYLK